MTKKERLAEVINQARGFRFCGPSDDGDEQSAVTSGYRYLVIQLKRLAGPLLPEAEASRLNAIEVEHDDIRSAYDAHAEIDALLPDIEAAVERLDDSALSVGGARIVDPELIDRMEDMQSAEVMLLAQYCRELNLCFAHGSNVATLLLMRTVLNYVPPLLGHETFDQVVANVGRSRKEAFEHLQNGLRKIADFHAHRRAGPAPMYPSAAQVEPFKPPFELLLQEVVAYVSARQL